MSRLPTDAANIEADFQEWVRSHALEILNDDDFLGVLERTAEEMTDDKEEVERLVEKGEEALGVLTDTGEISCCDACGRHFRDDGDDGCDVSGENPLCGTCASKKSYRIRIERYVQEVSYIRVEADNLDEAIRAAHEIDADELEFEPEYGTETPRRIYSVEPTDSEEEGRSIVDELRNLADGYHAWTQFSL